ncbi:hypothetical protein RND81_14G198600 [Saponaria officinalis]|uniref:Uncharacterized protein n=1 Tax=Saponaria officinalis TaxID=3572 RepID=A0AAW1GQ47_SAPOF
MAKDDQSAGNSSKPALHPVYSVTNILNKVRMLDGVKITFSSWVKLFTLHVRSYKVSHHIDDTRPPAKADPKYAEWCEIDAHVLQWIYESISEDLLVRHEFTNMSLTKCSSLDEYCQKLKDDGSQLTDVGSAVHYKINALK